MGELTGITNLRPSASPARLPALAAPNLSTEYLAQIKEILEVLTGRRGSPWDRAVTFRDLQEGGLGAYLPGGAAASLAMFNPGTGQILVNGSNPIDIDAAVRESSAYRDLLQRIGSVEDLAGFPEQIRQQLQQTIEEVARERGAAIRNVEYRIENQDVAISHRLEEITASLEQTAAGVRQFNSAYADEMRAVAVRVTQLAAQLEAGGGGVEIEERLTAISDAVEGLQGQWSLKIQTNPTAGQPPVIAGIALSVDDPIAGPGTSSLIFMAEKFGFLTGNGTMAPFTISGNNIVMNANVRINGTLTFGNVGTAIDAAKAAADTAIANDAIVAADNWLSKGEKPHEILKWNTIVGEFNPIQIQADSLLVGHTAFDNAYGALLNYLNSINTAPAWTDTAVDTPINGTTYRTNFLNYYNAKIALLNAIAAKSATMGDWPTIAGTGKPADNASSDVTLYSDSSISLAGNVATKTGGTNGAWDSQVISAHGYKGGAFAEAKIVAANLMFGLNADPNANASWETLDHAFYFYGTGNVLYIYENGVNTGSYGVWAAGDIFTILYDGSRVVYLKNGAEITRFAEVADKLFFFDSSFHLLGAKLSNIRFGPMTSNAYVGSTLATDIEAKAVSAIQPKPSFNPGFTGYGEASGPPGSALSAAYTVNPSGYTGSYTVKWTMTRSSGGLPSVAPYVTYADGGKTASVNATSSSNVSGFITAKLYCDISHSGGLLNQYTFDITLTWTSGG